jgi:hypothetical protein
MAAQNDFNLTLDHAAGLTMDATCSLRAVAGRSLPLPHRRLLSSAIRSLERAQDTLHLLRSDPWQSQTHEKIKQLTLL